MPSYLIEYQVRKQEHRIVEADSIEDATSVLYEELGTAEVDILRVSIDVPQWALVKQMVKDQKCIECGEEAIIFSDKVSESLFKQFGQCQACQDAQDTGEEADV